MTVGAMSISALRKNGNLVGFYLPLSDGSLKVKDSPNGTVIDTGTWTFDLQTQVSTVTLQSGPTITLSFVSAYDLQGTDDNNNKWTATLIQIYNP